VTDFPCGISLPKRGTISQRRSSPERSNEHTNLKSVFPRSQPLTREEGQDLVEYALVVALIAFGAIAGLGTLAAGLNSAFSQIALTLTSNVT